jgi:hypothetical protein
MMRRLIREGQEAVAAGREPKAVRGSAGRIISTYCTDTVVRVPKRDGVDDEQTLWRVGHAVAAIVTDPANGHGTERHARVVARVAALAER